uniref:Uncharacterized protein n=1 Tax=Arundo donax TaxID=35708 RepID=A0A0A8YTH9_ARUDO
MTCRAPLNGEACDGVAVVVPGWSRKDATWTAMNDAPRARKAAAAVARTMLFGRNGEQR